MSEPPPSSPSPSSPRDTLARSPRDTLARSPRDTLARSPELFDLDQAAFVLAPEANPVDIAYAAVPRLSLPLSEVSAADLASRTLTTPLFGLIGPGGTLPRHYTATTAVEARQRNRALQQFMDMLARRFTGMWVKAGAKYRPTRDPSQAERALDAIIGMGTAGLGERLAVPAASLRYHAGHLGARTRSAARLAAMLAEEAGTEVEIIEFAGGWLRMPPSEQTRLGAAHASLGDSAAAGAQVWDPQARFIIRLGPLAAEDFARLLPGQPLFDRLCGLTRLFVGPEQEFVLNPVLEARAVPASALGAGGARLGLTSWMKPSRPRTAPAGEAMLRPPHI